LTPEVGSISAIRGVCIKLEEARIAVRAPRAALIEVRLEGQLTHNASLQAVLQVPSDAGKIDSYWDAVLAQLVLWSNAGKHKYLGAVKRPCRKDNLTRGENLALEPWPAGELFGQKRGAVKMRSF